MGGKFISFDEEDSQTLVKLGLNFSQAKIYLTLISLGVADAKKIAQTAKIDRGEVYRQLDMLHRKGLLEKVVGFPNEYKPTPLNEAIKILIQQKNKEHTEIQQKAEALLKKGDHMHALKEEECRISVIPKDGYRKIYSTKEIDRAQEEMLWYTQIGRIPVALIHYHDAHKKAYDRGVRLRTIAELDKPTDEALRFIQRYKEENPNFDIRFANSTLLVSFTLFDDREMNFSIEKLTGVANSPMLITNNVQLIKIVKDYFELRWNSAIKNIPKKEE